MARSFFITLFCTIISVGLYAQTYSTENTNKKDSLLMDEAAKLVFAADYLKASETFKFKLDSIYINVEYSSGRILTNNFFINTNKSLDIYYYFSNDSLKYVRTVEKRLAQPGEATSSNYYFENEQILNEIHEGPRKIVSMCIAHSTREMADLFNYTPVFDNAFLRNYVISSFEIIKRKLILLGIR